MGGWAIVVADVIVMANLAQIAGLYGFLLVGWQSAADSTLAVTIVGVIWIVVMTAICVYGIELSARTQVGLLGAEILTLALFAVVAFVKVAAGDAGAASVTPELSWFNPFAISSLDGVRGGLAGGGVHLLGLGQHGVRERGDRRTRAAPGPRRGRLDADPRRHLRARLLGGDRVRRAGARSPRTTRATRSGCWARRCSARRSTSW